MLGAGKEEGPSVAGPCHRLLGRGCSDRQFSSSEPRLLPRPLLGTLPQRFPRGAGWVVGLLTVLGL